MGPDLEREGKLMLKNEVLPVSGLAEADVSQMYELMLKYYSNLDPGIFRNDLNEKDPTSII